LGEKERRMKRSVGMRWHGPDWSLPVGSASGHGVRKSSLIVFFFFLGLKRLSFFGFALDLYN
jgi:hypothetical protein